MQHREERVGKLKEMAKPKKQKKKKKKKKKKKTSPVFKLFV